MEHPQQPTNRIQNISKIVEETVEEGASLETLHPASLPSKKASITASPNLTVHPTGDRTISATSKISEGEEEEEEEGGLITTTRHRRGMQAVSSSLGKEHKTSIHGEKTSKSILPLSPMSSKAPTSLKRTPSLTPSCNLTKPEQESSYSKGQIIKNHGVTMSELVGDAQLSAFRSFPPANMAPSFAEPNQASAVLGAQEIVDMMKLEGLKPSLLAEAFKIHPQLRLPTNDRSKWMLCNSYRVLLNILNILTTKTPFTITEADKMLLADNLKDAHFVGFDKNWLESVKTRVLDCNISQFDRIQEDLKGLEDDMKINESMLEAICEEEVEIAQEVEVAQKELDAAQHKQADVIARHAHLLKAHQDILSQWHKCWEIIAAKNRHFGI
ncbi:uncharacterized protein LOC129312579 isoform X2 [Prosopis cineraria]|uniref:uncharacterized protein LOC129312579 isoform X2 n=1 Tax=Prosopis cineraria TaxID=364024 RepID=UPI00240FA19C|nr:uncharacterized protein LOC129312579 isoform X2 [Prosopis cineraria]